MQIGFSTSDIVRIFNIPKGRFREWLNLGFIAPHIQEATGPGTRNIFTEDDIYLIAIFKKLLDSGISRVVAGEYIDELFHHMTEKEVPAEDILFNEEIIVYRRNIENGVDLFDFGVFFKDSFTLKYAESPHLFKPASYKDSKKRELKLCKDWDYLLIINIGKTIREVQEIISRY